MLMCQNLQDGSGLQTFPKSEGLLLIFAFCFFSIIGLFEQALAKSFILFKFQQSLCVIFAI